jgi:uncharacterized membrane protein
MSTTPANDKLAAKKAAVLGTSSTRRAPLWAALACVLVLAAGLAWYLGGRPAQTQTASASGAKVSGDSVILPVSLFEDGRARYFEYQQEGITIRYFVIKSSDGVLRAAFDACDVCWRAGKGYAQDGDVMVCRNCGQRFASVRVNEVKGGCNPVPLERRVENGALLIRISDILQGRMYFDFPGKA